MKQGSIPTNNLSESDIPDILKLLAGNDASTLSLQQQQGANTAYRQFLHQNSLVAINTQGTAVPVTEVLAELQRQSNVQILVDPQVPRGPKFRMRLALTPLSLPETLNLMCPALHLNWRWIGNTIYITPTPDFEVFWGDSNAPRIIYGYGAPAQQSRGQQNTDRKQNAPADGQSGSDPK